MIPVKVDVPTKDILAAPTNVLKNPTSSPSPAANCAKIRDLGFTTSKHISMYGERFELVSDPFEEGTCTAVHVRTGNDPTIRTLRLPTAILVGLSDRFRKNQN
jgi:hypothetical protein